MAQTMLVISLCSMLIVKVLAAEEHFQANGGNNIEKNGSNEPPENIDQKASEVNVLAEEQLQTTGGDNIDENGSNKPPENIDENTIEGGKTSPTAPEQKPVIQECPHQPQNNGRLASPINIDDHELTDKKANLPIQHIQNFAVASFTMRIEEGTDRVEFIYPKADLNPEEHGITEMRVHVPPRHTDSGPKFTAELEFIYTEKQGEKKTPHVYGVSVFVQINAGADRFMGNFMTGIEAIHNGERTEFNLNDIFWKDRLSRGVWYEGTTMTPPCSQEVTRYISNEMGFITEEKAQVWTKHFTGKEPRKPPTPVKEFVFKDI